MECIAPITVPIETPPVRRLQIVRCGQCRACRIRRKLAWTGRMLMEFEEARERAFFLTLTYEDAPDVLDYRDFQLFMKRWRKANGPCRFVAVGEYGEKSGRGHWHAIIYNQLALCFGSHRIDSWNHGYAYFGSATRESIGYVAGYTLKENKDGRRSHFRTSNRPGIGLSGVRRLAKKTAGHFLEKPLGSWPSSYTIRGRRYPLCAGAQTAFQDAYLKKGGLPPRESDPDLLHSEAMAYSLGDAFFEERMRRDKWAALEKEGSDGQKARRITSL